MALATPTPTTTITLPILITTLLFSLLVTSTTASSLDAFVFGGCSQLKYNPGSSYESAVNSLLTSLLNSATFTTYGNFTLQSQYATPSASPLSALFQCRGDLGNADCARCVAKAVGQLGSLCPGSCGGALQLDGCFVKYDNATFLGVEDKSEVLKRCGPASIGYDSDSLTRRDAVLGSLEAGDGYGGVYKAYRVGSSGDAYGVAQCVQDLSPSECQDCLSDAIGRLKSYCGTSASGDMFLAKCYARFSVGGGATPHAGNGNNNNDNNDDDEIEKTLAILIGLIAGVALLIVFLSFLGKVCSNGKDCK